MLDVILPFGYKAVFIGSAASSEGLEGFETLEQGQAEGSRMLAQLFFEHRPPDFDHVVAQLNHKCLETGVESWPELGDIAFANPTQPIIYVCWQKGLIWWGWILLLLGTLVLPPLLMAGLWLILPEPVREMIEGITCLGIMGAVMFLMSKVTGGIITAGVER